MHVNQIWHIQSFHFSLQEWLLNTCIRPYWLEIHIESIHFRWFSSYIYYSHHTWTLQRNLFPPKKSSNFYELIHRLYEFDQCFGFHECLKHFCKERCHKNWIALDFMELRSILKFCCKLSRPGWWFDERLSLFWILKSWGLFLTFQQGWILCSKSRR